MYKTYHIQRSKLCGSLTIPASKSHSQRAILFASLADGRSIIRNSLPSPDIKAMIHACRSMGAVITVNADQIEILGTNGTPQALQDVVDAGNSGQVLRFIAAVASLTAGYTVITGDRSIRKHRPMQPLLDGLNQLGVWAVSMHNTGTAPILIQGPWKHNTATIDGAVSQPISGLLIAAAFAPRPTNLYVTNHGETTWIDVTLNWFDRLGIIYTRKDYAEYQITGNARYAGFKYTVPGDLSSCAFPIIGALITNSELTLHGVDLQDVQGDKELIFILQRMGAKIEIDHAQQTIQVQPSPALTGITLNINAFNDAVPVLAVLACFATSPSIISGAAATRTKESDRLATIAGELNKMGANITEHADGLTIHPATLTGTTVQAHQDHRIAMALSIAALAANGETRITGTECIDKSYPNFANDLISVGAKIDVLPSLVKD